MNFKKITKKTAALLLGICIAIPCGATAATPDMSAVSSLFMKNSVTKLLTPITETMDSALLLSVRAAQKRAKADAERIDRGHVAYVVSATQKLNMETDLYYLELTLINGTGKFTLQTVDDVRNYRYSYILKDKQLGRLKNWERGFVRFDTNSDGLIKRLDEPVTQINKIFSEKDGLYLVNVADISNGRIYFYETNVEVSDLQNTRMSSAKLREKGAGYDVISLDGEDYLGNSLRTVSLRGEGSLPKGFGNAVIQINDGEVIRVFSFEGGYEN